MQYNDRTQLESTILKALCTRSELFDLFPLAIKDFQNPINKKIFTYLIDLYVQNIIPSLVSLSSEFQFSEIKHLFEDDIFIIPRDFEMACQKLREDALKIEILQKIQICKNSFEFFQFIDQLKTINTIGNLDDFNDNLEKYIKENEEILQRIKDGNSIGLLNYWDQFSKKVPMLPGDYCVIGANTSVGKTSFSLNIAVNAATLEQKVLFISLEMPRKHVFDKIAAMLSQKSVYDFKFVKNPLNDTKRILKTLKNNFQFVFAPDATSNTIRQIVKRVGKVDLIVIDYIQIICDQAQRGESENLRISKISKSLKLMAGENNCVVIAPSQLNRDNAKQNREPRLSDLRDSGSLEQDAAIVLLLHRDEEENKAKTKVIVAKNRTGEQCTIDFAFNPICSYFEELKNKKTENKIVFPNSSL